MKISAQKKRAALFAAALLVLTTAFGEGLTIHECYEAARNNYPMIRQFDLIAKTADFTLANASTGYLPQFTLSANAAYLSDTPSIGTTSLIKQQAFGGYIQASQVLWDGGDISAKQTLTKAQAKAELQNNEVILYGLIQRVNEMFFGILLQDELLKQNLTRQSDIQNSLDKISALLANGTASAYDLELMKVELLSARQDASEIRASRRAYVSMLAALTGKHIDETSALETPAELGTLSDTINRPELDYYDASEAFLEAKKGLVDAGLMPRISLFGLAAYGQPSLPQPDSADFYGLGGINFSWSFGNFYTEQNEKMKITEEKKSVRAKRDAFLFDTRIQMILENSEIKKYSTLIESDAEIVALRESIKNSARARMENGVITVTDFIKELNSENLAKQRYSYHKIQKLSKEYNYLYISNGANK